MTVLGTIKMSADQFMQLGEDPPGVWLELVDGEIAVSPSPTPQHSYADRQLSALLSHHIDEHNSGLLFGDVDTIFGEHDVRRPDLIYFSHKRSHLIGDGAMEGPPDLCVEIVSSSSVTIDRIDKFRQYEAGGVLHYWIIDPREKSIEGFKLRRGKFVSTGKGRDEESVALPPFPELMIPLSKLRLKVQSRSAKRPDRK